MTTDDLDEAFDLWDTGREDVIDIECVIALDVSGSMAYVIENAYQSMWAIKRALDKVGASTTVVTFATEGEERLVYSADEKAELSYRSAGVGGGTQPSKAINYAKYVLANSNRAIKIFIAITDGEWYGEDNKMSEDAIAQLRKGGIITALGMIDSQSLEHGDVTINGHGCESIALINDMGQLFTLAKDMVRVGIKRNLLNN